MAIALVKSATGVSATAITAPAFSSATTTGNLIVLGFASDDYNVTPDAGWTQSTGMEQQFFHGGYLWWRISAGETAFQYTIGSATGSAWVLAEFSGCDATPYDISSGTGDNAGGSTKATLALVPTTGERVLVAMVGGSLSTSLVGTYDPWSNSFIAIQSGGTSTGSTKDCCGLAYRLVTGNGSTSFTTTGDYTGATSCASRSGLIISFKEAVGGGGTTTLAAAAGSYSLTGSAAVDAFRMPLGAAGA